MQNRIEVFKQMLEADPSNTMVMFGLAKEYEKAEQYTEVVNLLLEDYLAKADDEGNAYGMLAAAYQKTGNSEKAKAALDKRNRSFQRSRSSLDGAGLPDDFGNGLRGLRNQPRTNTKKHEKLFIKSFRVFFVFVRG